MGRYKWTVLQAFGTRSEFSAAEHTHSTSQLLVLAAADKLTRSYTLSAQSTSTYLYIDMHGFNVHELCQAVACRTSRFCRN